MATKQPEPGAVPPPKDRLVPRQRKGVFRTLNPTNGFLESPLVPTSVPSGIKPAANDPQRSHDAVATNACCSVAQDGIDFLWRSRDNRKGRHPLRVLRPLPGSSAASLTVPRRSSHPKEVCQTVLRTVTYFPVWDISWLVAFIFTWGSIIWVINAFFAWLPFVRPSTKFPGETYYGGGITAFVGAIAFFELGSILLILEAVNAKDASCFGWAVESALDSSESYASSGAKLVTEPHSCCHHHNRNRGVRHTAQDRASTRLWQWWPSWEDLRTHYIYELGFLAAAAQLFGATVFGVAGFTALPGIANHLTPQWRLNAAYWIPQVVGGSGFIVSSALYMLETQTRWWKPAPRLLGWHIAFWNLVGAFGFTLCGALGMAYGSSGAQYQAALAIFWGSWAFLIGSYLQLYEALNKYPVEEVKLKK